MEEENKNVFKSALSKMIKIFFVTVALLFVGLIFIINYQPHYTWFTKNRRTKMEDIFSIRVTDNIRLENYRGEDFFDDTQYLYLYAYDLEKFKEENVNGTITEKYDSSDSIKHYIGGFRYTGTGSQEVLVQIFKYDNEDYYRISLDGIG
ncbi:MAG: hypothetical protein K2I06_06790 [Ruminococcus sp.]|nr:hypothetical protein [Ruminococcus sp.]